MGNKKRIPLVKPIIEKEELSNVIEAVKSGWISSRGYFVKEFERKFGEWIGIKHSVAVSNGTVALHLALLALGVGSGDEVIIPNLTFASPANMTILTGARPVFTDVTKEYWCIDPDEIEKQINPRTKAIIVVHLYGHPAKMDEIMEIAEKHNLYVIEDCAEAHGAMFNNSKVCTIGHIGTFSFYGNKIITTGEGGMVVTNDSELAKKIRIMRDHGMKPRYWHISLGFNYRMTNLQAAIGVAQIDRVEDIIKRKREIAILYSNEFESIPGIKTHPEMPWAKNVFWLYSILIDEKKYGYTRDDLTTYLSGYGIETRKFFYPLSIMPIYRKYVTHEYPTSFYLSKHGINLPSGPKISDNELISVIELIKKKKIIK